jgi:lysophospholipase L1-like esterase
MLRSKNMKLEKGQKLVMIGDSITDCGRVRPAGEGLGEALGKGYVALVDAQLAAAYPKLGIRIVNKGLGGNRVRELKARWQEDVIALKPDWASIMIGINDVWRQFDLPRQAEEHVLPDEYESTLGELIQQTRPKVKGLVMLTPYFIEPNVQDAMRARMDQYSAIVRKIAKVNDAILIDTQAAFDEVLATYHPMTLAWDRVHPNLTGHMVIARAFLKGIGFGS